MREEFDKMNKDLEEKVIELHRQKEENSVLKAIV